MSAILQAREKQPLGALEIKKSTKIVLAIEEMHKSDDWHNPGCFEPQRFSNKDRPYFGLIPRAAAVPDPSCVCNHAAPFGDGPKGCVGQHLAMREMVGIAYEILSKYNISYVEPNMSLCSLETRWDIANQPTSNIRVRIETKNDFVQTF